MAGCAHNSASCGSYIDCAWNAIIFLAAAEFFAYSAGHAIAPSIGLRYLMGATFLYVDVLWLPLYLAPDFGRGFFHARAVRMQIVVDLVTKRHYYQNVSNGETSWPNTHTAAAL